jgi:hypothetical protein
VKNKTKTLKYLSMRLRPSPITGALSGIAKAASEEKCATQRQGEKQPRTASGTNNQSHGSSPIDSPLRSPGGTSLAVINLAGSGRGQD